MRLSSQHLGKKLKTSANALLLWVTLSGIHGTTSAAELPEEGISLLESVKIGIEFSPAVQTAHQSLRISAATLENNKAPFDPTLSLSSGYGKTAGFAATGGNSNSLSSRVALEQRLPSGITIGPQVSLSRFGYSEGGAPIDSASVGMSIRVPLLKGLGNDNMYRSKREAAAQSLQAEERTLVHTVETSVHTTANAYWNYVYAWRMREVWRRLSDIAREQLITIKALADADQTAKINILNSQAYLEQRQADEVSAELAVESSWQNLLLAMGLNPALHAEPLAPMDAFPSPTENNSKKLPPLDALQEAALLARADLQATKLATASSETMLKGYRNALEPDISLSLYGGYNGGDTGNSFTDYIAPLNHNVPGANLSATLTWTIQMGRRADHAAYITQQAQLEQSRISQANLERAIRSNVSVALEGVKNAATVCILNRKRTSAYQTLKDGEMKKFKAGLSNIYNLQQANDNLAAASQSLIQAEQQFALALLSLRQATGTLVDEKEGSIEVRTENLVSLPTPGAKTP